MTGGVSQDATISLYSGNPLLYNTSAGTRWAVYEGFKNILINKHKNTNAKTNTSLLLAPKSPDGANVSC